MKLGIHRDTLADALAGADAVWVRRPDWLEWDIDAALAPLAQARLADDVDEIVAASVAMAKHGDRIVVMSNGGFDGIHERLARALEARFGAVAPV